MLKNLPYFCIDPYSSRQIHIQSNLSFPDKLLEAQICIQKKNYTFQICFDWCKSYIAVAPSIILLPSSIYFWHNVHVHEGQRTLLCKITLFTQSEELCSVIAQFFFVFLQLFSKFIPPTFNLLSIYPSFTIAAFYPTRY